MKQLFKKLFPNRIREDERGQVFVLFIVLSSLVFVAAVGAIDLPPKT